MECTKLKTQDNFGSVTISHTQMDKDRAPEHRRGRAWTIEIETNLRVGREDGRGGDERQREDCSNSKTKIHDSIFTIVDCKLCESVMPTPIKQR